MEVGNQVKVKKWIKTGPGFVDGYTSEEYGEQPFTVKRILDNCVHLTSSDGITGAYLFEHVKEM